jgi:glyoxylase-like metal-dependent hydrolase (beta-lactamase superfamily II)
LPGGNEAALAESIRECLLSLPDDTVVYPGHGPATTVGHERAANPFLEPAP